MNLSKEEAKRRSAAYAEKGFLCSESVLMTIAECLDISSDLIPRIATGFGAGVGRKGEICGAISGAIMGLGLQLGRDSPLNRKDGRRPYWFASELIDLFIETFGESRCNQLTGLDLNRNEDLIKYQRNKIWEVRCRNFIMTATELAYDVLSTSLQEAQKCSS